MQMCNPLIDSAGHATVMKNSDVPFSLSRGSDGVTRLDNKSFQSNGLSTGSPGSNTMLLLHQPLALPLHHHSQPVSNGSSEFGNAGAFCFSAAIPGTGGGGSSSSGKTTPRQPAKKRLEARTPTIEGCLTDEGSNGGGTQGTPILVSGSDDYGSALLGTVSGGGSCVVAFRVHQNTPFVPVQSRSGRPSSGGSTSSGSIIPNVNVTNNTESSGGPGVSLVSTANRCLPETEEGEMDQELVDIMVRRSGSTCNSNYFPGDGTVSRSPCTLGTDENSHRPIVCPLGFPATATELGTSPTGRRIIKAFVASLTGSHGSPLHGNSTPINPRRSASACSLPRLGSSPNDDLTEFLLHSNANGNALLFSSPNACGSWQPSRDAVSFLNNQQQQQNNTSSKSHWLTEYVTTTGRRSAGSALQGGNCATPPPSLSSSTNSGTLGELRLLGGTRVLGQSILHTPTLNGDGSCAPDTSVQELTNAIRNSPACGISQELIDMLANMAQQYGVQHPRPGSGASRPSSQVAQRFYRSLVNGSVCASPFLGGTFNGSSVSGVATNTTTQALSASGGTGSSSATTTTTTANSTGAITPLLSPTGTFSSQNQTGSHHQHHLRGLSFTPLAVDADLGGSLPSGINSTTANSSDCFVTVSNGPLCTTSPTIKHSCAVENTTTLATCELRGDIAPARSANSAGNGFFPCRRPLK
ncbi:Nuclear factor 1 C-type [Fasciola gigantica]|uniref:Nuclear factor 1 C-type n=1 Tax=Fasciola gigantica TaxID=46835 RepID=A0A504YFD3_FASGI|nr:Nuclear factor 1 C-type [Fasciola gigantica]